MAPVPTNLVPSCKPGWGVGVMMKLSLPVSVPPTVVTEILPVAAFGITIPTRVVSASETTIADTPPIVKAVGLLRCMPVICTKVPTGPLEGLKDIMLGA